MTAAPPEAVRGSRTEDKETDMLSEEDKNRLWDCMDRLSPMPDCIRGAGQALQFRVDTGSGDLEDNFYEFISRSLIAYGDVIEEACSEAFDLIREGRKDSHAEAAPEDSDSHIRG